MISYENRLEKSLDITLRDGKKIRAILRGELTKETPVMIMMHGRPGSSNELLQYLGAHYISERGITTLRLSMYEFGEQYRNLVDCTLNTHIQDFEDVIDYLRDVGVGHIFALGHSYGGITIMGSDAQLDGAVLWDPSHGLAWLDDSPDFTNDNYPEKTVGDIVIGTGGHGYIKSLQQDAYDKSLGDTTSWAENKKFPMKFILASAGPLAKYAKQYYDAAAEPKAIVEIKEAHHQFLDSDEVVEKLFDETVEWVKRLKGA